MGVRLRKSRGSGIRGMSGWASVDVTRAKGDCSSSKCDEKK